MDAPRRTQRTHLTHRVLLALASIALLAACASAADSPSVSPSAGIRVGEAWARSSSAMASAAAAYATITNAGTAADALVGASSPAAATVEVHETVAVGSPAASSGTMSGGTMMGMQPVARVEIPAGGSLQLKPGGYHVMLIGLVWDLAVGDTIDLTLVFEKAGPITVKAEVRAS
jgi:copper(I)-binding protein